MQLPESSPIPTGINVNTRAPEAKAASFGPAANTTQNKADIWWRSVKKQVITNWLKLSKYLKATAVSVKDICKRVCKNLFVVTPVLSHADHITMLKSLIFNKERCLKSINTALALARTQHEYYCESSEALQKTSDELQEQHSRLNTTDEASATEQLDRSRTVISEKLEAANNEKKLAADLVEDLDKIAKNLSNSIEAYKQQTQTLSNMR